MPRRVWETRESFRLAILQQESPVSSLSNRNPSLLRRLSRSRNPPYFPKLQWTRSLQNSRSKSPSRLRKNLSRKTISLLSLLSRNLLMNLLPRIRKRTTSLRSLQYLRRQPRKNLLPKLRKSLLLSTIYPRLSRQFSKFRQPTRKLRKKKLNSLKSATKIYSVCSR